MHQVERLSPGRSITSFLIENIICSVLNAPRRKTQRIVKIRTDLSPTFGARIWCFSGFKGTVGHLSRETDESTGQQTISVFLNLGPKHGHNGEIYVYL